MKKDFDVAIVGGGIVGLAHAWMASRRGLSVILLERTGAAEGASVRNFGMIWPIGQPAGRLYSLALRSRDFWLELGSMGVLPVEPCGSIHLAHRVDELELLEEFSGNDSHDTRMLTAEEVLQRSDLANPDNLFGGMQSPTELRVDPRTASRRIASWLVERHDVEIQFSTTVVSVDQHEIAVADGRRWSAGRTIVCSGSDLNTLYPDLFDSSGLILCKLQMLRTAKQANDRGNAPHIASGLTLRHYASFESCSTHARLRQRIADETPELDAFGIHVMASQFPGGEVVLGDSHEYGDQITPFDKTEIDSLILRELRKVIRLDDWTITERWHGIYAKHPDLPVFQAKTPDGNQLFVGTGGSGMTMSFGLADQAWKQWLGENE